MESIGDRVKAKRIRLGLSQAALSGMTGITQATLSRLENGVHENSMHLPLVAKALNCSTEYLLYGNTSDLPTELNILRQCMTESQLALWIAIGKTIIGENT